MSIVVGFIGRKGAGKSTAARILKTYGFVQLHPAETIREMLVPFLRAYGVAEDLIPRYLDGDLKRTVIPEVGRTPTELQQTLGTEWGRQCVRPSVWTAINERKAKLLPRWYNDSIRFEDEAAVIRSHGGLLIRVLGVPTGERTLDDHASETEQDAIRADLEINNNGTIMQLHLQVLEAVLKRYDADLAA